MSKGIKIHCILQPGAVSNFDAYFPEILMIKGKNPGGGGGLTPKGIVENQTHFVFGSYWVGSSI